MDRKSITLIRPNMGAYRSTDALPSLAMAIIAARTPEHFDVSFYDDRIEDLPKDNPDLVAFLAEQHCTYETSKEKTRTAQSAAPGFSSQSCCYATTVIAAIAVAVWSNAVP
jgi:hypothetical protein